MSNAQSEVINWGAGTPGPWEMGQNAIYEEALIAKYAGRMVAYAAWDGGSGCHLEIENPDDARAIAEVPAMVRFIRQIERGYHEKPIGSVERELARIADAILARIDGAA